MREYRRVRRGIALFLTLYFAGGILTLLHPAQEVFPVYSWFLFALVPQTEPDYALLLHEVNGRPAEPPRLYQEASDLVNSPHSITVYELTQQMGKALKRGENESSYRELLERNWLPPRTSYDLVKIYADPIVRWKTGQYKIETVRTFRTAPSSR
jgi:hypothetical protein